MLGHRNYNFQTKTHAVFTKKHVCPTLKFYPNMFMNVLQIFRQIVILKYVFLLNPLAYFDIGVLKVLFRFTKLNFLLSFLTVAFL